jgi:hypothetical protein
MDTESPLLVTVSAFCRRFFGHKTQATLQTHDNLTPETYFDLVLVAGFIAI